MRFRLLSAPFPGVSHSLVVHELWVLVVGGSNPSTPNEIQMESDTRP